MATVEEHCQFPLDHFGRLPLMTSSAVEPSDKPFLDPVFPEDELRTRAGRWYIAEPTRSGGRLNGVGSVERTTPEPPTSTGAREGPPMVAGSGHRPAHRGVS